MNTIRQMSQLCPIQAALLKEKVMVVDKTDKILKPATKEEAHLMTNIKKRCMLHRAFSLFLFNSENQLLMQRRSSEKITFPNLYTNTCCSHPLYTIPKETDGVSGVKNAVIRRVKDELGITELKYEDLVFMTRIIYYGASSGDWGEHELDYVVIAKKNVNIVPNPNEVSEIRYIDLHELKDLLSNETEFPVTPWFRIIANSMLTQWWNDIDRCHELGDNKIHEFSNPPLDESF